VGAACTQYMKSHPDKMATEASEGIAARFPVTVSPSYSKQV
jgi:hypothetical protein